MLRPVPTDRLDDAHAAGRLALGAWMVAPTDVSLGVLAAADLDFVCVDTQHSLVTEAEAGRLLARYVDAPLTTLVRTSSNDTALIGRVLDAGANGVIVPMVEDADEAAAAVAACRYPPDGVRSWGPLPGAGTRAELEQRARCLVMIESARGYENLDAIVATEGLAGVYVGPNDLSIGLGTTWSLADPPDRTVDAMRRIAAACKGAGILAGTHPTTGAGAAWCAGLGFGMATVAVDTGLLGAGVAAEISAARRG
jgi:4-hydroxy-2-oxoheptanedioate aldolase